MRLFISILFSFSSLYLFAQVPAGYYNSAVGKSGSELKTALYQIISSHTELAYTDLWSAFSDTDKKDDGSVWDVYSSCSFSFSTSQCGNYTQVCDCYNREHSMPKAWFDSASPMYTDLFHIYPTDGRVNNQRANYPLGECDNGSSLSSSAQGKLGTSSYSTYTGTVFEPADEYKGDFARTYFYMVTCYENQVATWTSDQLSGDSYPALSDWSVSMFLEWNAADPVSEKEEDRNNVIYTTYQHNRNPFIDHPELADYIWGDKKTESWDLSSSLTESSKSEISVEKTSTYVQVNNPQSDSYSYVLINAIGDLCSKGITKQQNLSFNLSELRLGIYLLTISSQNYSTTVKIIVSE